MKNAKILLLVLILISCFAMSVFCQTARIINVDGRVDVMLKDRTDWQEAKEGLKLKRGDRVKTGRDAECDLAIDKNNENVVGVLEDSDIVISFNGNEKIEIVNASLFIRLNKLPRNSTFEVKTPTAVCGARGTGFGIKAGKGSTQASAFDNNIFTKNNKGEKKDIKEGFSRTIDKMGKISKQLANKMNAMQKYNSWTKKIDRMNRNRKGLSKRKEMLSGNIAKSIEKTTEMVEKSDQKSIDAREERVETYRGTKGE